MPRVSPIMPQRMSSNEMAMLAQIGCLRTTAWKADGALPAFVQDRGQWLDEHDEHATHWACFSGNRLVAAARFCVHEKVSGLPDLMSVSEYTHLFRAPVGSFNGLVVHPDFRGRGISALLDESRLKAARDARCRSVIATSHKRGRAIQLEQAGFRTLGKSSYQTVPYAPSFVFLRTLLPGDH
jgi:GNAT superfamily N-acetyltransferase